MIENYALFVTKVQTYVAEKTKNWGAKVKFEKGDSKDKEDLLVVTLSETNKGSHIQRFHLEEIYSDYKDGTDLNELFDEIGRCLDQCKKIQKGSPIDFIQDYEAIKQDLIIRPLNYKMNKIKLDDGVYELVGDIALALYVYIGDFDGLYTSVMVPKLILKAWKISTYQVMEEAKKNTYRLFSPRLYNWVDTWRFGEKDYGIFMETDAVVKLDGGVCATFITNERQINGAVAVFLPGVAKRLGELMGTDFYIAFTSMHEAAIHSCEKVSTETIRESLKGLNEEMPSEDDFLSEKVYYYNRSTDRIEVVLD